MLLLVSRAQVLLNFVNDKSNLSYTVSTPKKQENIPEQVQEILPEVKEEPKESISEVKEHISEQEETKEETTIPDSPKSTEELTYNTEDMMKYIRTKVDNDYELTESSTGRILPNVIKN